MFLKMRMERNISLHPCQMGPHLRDEIVKTLLRSASGTYIFHLGHVTAVSDIESVGEGRLCSDGSGCVLYPVRFQSIVFRPFKGEIIQAAVTSVHRMGIFAQVGPVQIFISSYYSMPDDVEFEREEIQNPAYRNAEGSMKIEAGSAVSVEIVGIRLEVSDIRQSRRGLH